MASVESVGQACARTAWGCCAQSGPSPGVGWRTSVSPGSGKGCGVDKAGNSSIWCMGTVLSMGHSRRLIGESSPAVSTDLASAPTGAWPMVAGDLALLSASSMQMAGFVRRPGCSLQIPGKPGHWAVLQGPELKSVLCGLLECNLKNHSPGPRKTNHACSHSCVFGSS
jgi:hypothetical protein